MTNDAFHAAIKAGIDAMSAMLATASTSVSDARTHAQAGERNAAIGALMSAQPALRDALALSEAIVTMHRFKP